MDAQRVKKSLLMEIWFKVLEKARKSLVNMCMNPDYIYFPTAHCNQTMFADDTIILCRGLLLGSGLQSSFINLKHIPDFKKRSNVDHSALMLLLHSILPLEI